MLRNRSQPALYYGWFIVAVTFFISFVTVGSRSGFGLFVKIWEKDFGWDRTDIAVAFVIGTLISGLSQPFLGRLFDQVGGRKVILANLVVFGVCTILLSLTFHILFLILMYGVVMAIAMSGGSVNTTAALVARWFRRKRSTALGLSIAGTSAGALLLVPFAAYLLDLTSWRIVWVVMGGIILTTAVPLSFFILRDDPSDLGLQPDGVEPGPLDGQGKPEPSYAPGPLEVSEWRESFRSFPIWQLSAGYFVCGFTTNIISMHFVPYAQDQGFSLSVAATAFGLMMGINGIGVIAAGALSDRFGSKNVLTSVYALRGGAYCVLLLAPGGWGLWGFACVAGLSWIATLPLTTSLTADIYGVKNLGTLTGVAFLCHQVGGSISVLMAAMIYDATSSYTIPFTACAVLLGFASLVAFSIQERKYSVKYQARPGPQPYAMTG